MTELDLAELERLAKATLEKPEPPFLTSFDYPAEVDESNLDDLTEYLFDAGADWANWNSASTVLALVAHVREAEARIEKVRGLSRYTVCDPTMTWTAVDAEDLDAVLPEGDEQ